MHAQLDAVLGAARDAQQLDAVTQFLGVLHVLAGELRDALGVGAVELHRDAEGDRRQDGELVRGVDALDVEGRVGFGVAQPLRFLQHVVEGRALVAHLGQDEVAGAVDDAGQPLDAVGGEALAQRLDDGDAARHRRLERHHHATGLRRGEDLVAVLGDQMLVGGDHVLAVGDRLQHQFARWLEPADQFDHDVDFRVVDDVERVGRQRQVAGQRTGFFQVAHGRAHHADFAPGAAGDFFGIAAQHGERAATDSAQAQQADVDGFHVNNLNQKIFIREGREVAQRKPRKFKSLSGIFLCISSRVVASFADEKNKNH